MRDRFSLLGSDLSMIGRMMIARPAVPAAYSDHRDTGHAQAAAVRPRVREETPEGMFSHSVNRYLSSVQMATMPSRQVIFLPSSYPRPS